METVDVPFQLPIVLIPETVTVIALELGREEPQTAPEQIAMFNDWVRHLVIQKISNLRGQRAFMGIDIQDLEAWEALS